ncbi:hypothetical protein BKA70DRAFT_1397960 [Coprinopsis sp. MPI-PUGE-AT-0042]|nr:hypothetical protein BKA70DRAFT_1397960 [Coprinopsis sp. MPI-PUGE-AT-0042]
MSPFNYDAITSCHFGSKAVNQGCYNPWASTRDRRGRLAVSLPSFLLEGYRVQRTMATRFPRPLPPSPDSRVRLSDASNSSASSENVSIFPHASGAVQINDGEFSAIKGGRYDVQITINQNGGPRNMNSSRKGPRKPMGSSASSVSGPRFAAAQRVARPPPAGKEIGIEMLSELAEQISEKCKEREQHLDDREAELDAKERDLTMWSEKIQIRENDLRRKERQLATLESDMEGRQESLDYAQHKLSIMKDSLLHREDLIKDVIADLRDRERVLEEQSISVQNHTHTCSSEPNTLSVTFSGGSRATSMLPFRAQARQLPLISPNRRHPSRTSAMMSSLPAIVEELSEVRVTHRCGSPSRPSSPVPRPNRPGSALPLAHSPALSLESRGLSDRESSGNEWDGLSDISSSENLPDMDDDLDDFAGDERETMADRPPTYHTYHERTTGLNLPSEPFGVELAAKLRAALFSKLKMSPRNSSSPEATISVSTSFSGTILREHVDDIALIDDQAERARAISWAIGMMVETGRFDEGTVRTLCERVSEDEHSADVAVRALKKDLERPHLALIQLYAVRLLRMMLANTNAIFHEQCSLPHFMEALEEIKHSDETNPAVRERTREVIDAIRKGRSALPQLTLRRVDEARVYEGFATPIAYGMAY